MSDAKKINQDLILRPDNIASPEIIVHPALDWLDGRLLVGVVLKDGNRAALSSEQGLIPLDQIGHICERDGNFESPVTPELAQAFAEYVQNGVGPSAEQEARELLERTAQYLRRFVVFPEEWWPDVLAVWSWGTCLFPMFQAYPYLRLTSPEPGCGKSLLGHIIANLSFNGEFVASPTEASLFHMPEQNRGVQVWDEFELSSPSEKNRFQSLKAVLLSGYRNGGTVPRQVGNSWEKTVRYHVYCPRVLIGLSDVPEPVRQRTIELRLRKRRSGEEIELYRAHAQLDEERAIRSKCVLAALKCASRINRAYNSEELRKRLEQNLGQVGREVDDIWLPLFAIAAATSSNENIDFGENPWLQRLAEAARKRITLRDAKTIGWDSPGLPTQSDESQDEREKASLIAALNTLEWARGISPSDLAERVSQSTGLQVSTQWLSKKLKKRLGIRASKRGGKRAFNPSPEETRKFLALLGIEPPAKRDDASGQQGQQGQKSQESGQVELVEGKI